MAPDHSEQDETRLCPTCRMPISVLATRCRYCGESVGRPRKEEEKLTVKDLGGEKSQTYTLSGNVTDALEAFRAEEMSQSEIRRQQQEAAARSPSWFGSRSTPPPEVKTSSNPGLPELDERSRELASISNVGASTVLRPPVRGPEPLSRKLFTIGAVAAGLVLLYLGSDFAWGRIKEYIEERNNAGKIVYHNKALAMLEQGRPVIDAFEEAMAALKVNDTDENRGIATKVREALAEEVEELLRQPHWSRQQHDEASAIVSRAALHDHSVEITHLLKRVDDEVAAYKLVLTKVDEGGRATFKLSDPSGPPEQTVGEGDRVAGRFLVQRVTRGSVRLLDERVPSGTSFRALNCRIMTPVTGE